MIPNSFKFWPATARLASALLLSLLRADVVQAKLTIVAVDGLPPELAYVAKGLAPVLLAQPTY